MDEPVCLKAIKVLRLVQCTWQAGEGEVHKAGGLCELAGRAAAGAGPGGAAPAGPGDGPGPVGHVPGLRGQAPAGPAGEV